MEATVVVFADDARRDLARLDAHGLVDHAAQLGVVTHLDVTRQREILAEGVADEAVVGEDAAQVVVALEDDAVKVKSFALVPVGGAPDVGERGQHREGVIGRIDAQAHALVEADRQQVGDGGITRAFPGAVAVGGVIDPAEIDELLEAAGGVVAQDERGRVVIGGTDLDGDLVKTQVDAAGLAAERGGYRGLEGLGMDGNGGHGNPFRRARWSACGGPSAGAG